MLHCISHSPRGNIRQSQHVHIYESWKARAYQFAHIPYLQQICALHCSIRFLRCKPALMRLYTATQGRAGRNILLQNCQVHWLCAGSFSFSVSWNLTCSLVCNHLRSLFSGAVKYIMRVLLFSIFRVCCALSIYLACCQNAACMVFIFFMYAASITLFASLHIAWLFLKMNIWLYS